MTSGLGRADRERGVSVGEGSAGQALIVGAGLIGTSIGLALARRGWGISFDDLNTERGTRAALLVDEVAERGPVLSTGKPLTVVIVAVAPEDTGAVLLRYAGTYINATVMDTASVKSQPAHEVEDFGSTLTNIVLSHPLGGGASTGPENASAELFTGRVWALSRTGSTAADSIGVAERVVRDCGAVPYWVTPERHDAVLAVTSHLPQLLASGLAASVADLGSGAVGLAGPALVEMTRIADSPIEMWTQIALANREPLGAGLDHVIGLLGEVREALRSDDPGVVSAAVTALLLRGRAGRSLISAKHRGLGGSDESAPTGRETGSWVWVEATLSDVPGRLAAVLLAAADRGINVEDVRFDHAPHAAAGTVALAVEASQATALRAALAAVAGDDPVSLL